MLRFRSALKITLATLVVLALVSPSVSFANNAPSTDSHNSNLGPVGYFGIFSYSNGTTQDQIYGGQNFQQVHINSVVRGVLRPPGSAYAAEKSIGGENAYQFDVLSSNTSSPTNGGYDAMNINHMNGFWQQSGANVPWLTNMLNNGTEATNREPYGLFLNGQQQYGYYSTSDLFNLGGWRLGKGTLTSTGQQWPASQLPTTGAVEPSTFANVSLTPSVVPMPQFAIDGLVNIQTGQPVTQVQTGTQYELRFNVLSVGFNGGYYNTAHIAAYWIPVSSSGVLGAPLLDPSVDQTTGAAFAQGWPSPKSVANAGGMSGLSGYPGGIPNEYDGETYPFGGSGITTTTVQVPSSIPSGTSKLDLVIYYGDDIARYDAQVYSVSLPQQPTCAEPPQFTGGSTVTATSGTQSVQVKGNPGDTIGLSVSNGTFSSGGTSTTVTLDSFGYGSATVFQNSGAISSTVTITSDSNTVCSTTGQTETIDWPAPPAQTCTVPPQFTAGNSVSNVASPYEVQVKGNPGDTLTLSVSGATFSSGESTTAVTLDSFGYGKVTVDQGTATITTVTITGDNNGACATGETLAISWEAGPTVTLIATANGQSYSARQTVAVTTNTPVSLTATITNAPVNNYTLEISDVGLNNTLAGQNNVFANNAATISAQANSGSALTDEYQATLILNQTGQHIPSGAITVDWTSSSTPPPSSGPALTLAAASSTEPTVFAIDTVTATGTNIPAGDTIVITQTNSNGGDTFGGSGHTLSSGGYTVSSSSDPYQVNINDASGVGGYTATYNAVAIDPSTGQTVAQSSDVNVTWGQIPASATVTLSITPSTQQENQYVTATVTTTNVQPQEYVWIYPQNTYSGPNPTPAAWVETGQNGTFTVSFTSSQVGAQTYVAVVTNGQVTFGGSNYNINEAVSNPVAVTWTAASAPTIDLGVNLEAVTGTWVNGQPVTYDTFGGTTATVPSGQTQTDIGGMIGNTVGNAYDPTVAWTKGKVNGQLFGYGTFPAPFNQADSVTMGVVQSVDAWDGSVPQPGLGWYTYQAMEPAGPGQTSAGYSNDAWIDWPAPTTPPPSQWGTPALISLTTNTTQTTLGNPATLTSQPQFEVPLYAGSKAKVTLYNVTDPANPQRIDAFYATVVTGYHGYPTIVWHIGNYGGPVVPDSNPSGSPTGTWNPLLTDQYGPQQAGTMQFLAFLTMAGVNKNGNTYDFSTWSSTVSVTWNAICAALPTKPANTVIASSTSPAANGGQTITWEDTHWVQGTNAQGCPVWVDQPMTYSHTYTPSVSGFQITGLFEDPGTPGNLWSPLNPKASQSDNNGATDGSTRHLPTYGNPNGSPMVYVRLAAGFGYRALWTGSPFAVPTSVSAAFVMTNPDGSTRSWTLDANTAPDPTYINQASLQDNQTINPNTGADGYPAPATEYVSVYTPIPKYMNMLSGYFHLELGAWNMTGQTRSAATIGTALQVSVVGGSVSARVPDMAQLLNYPAWYMIHQVLPVSPSGGSYQAQLPIQTPSSSGSTNSSLSGYSVPTANTPAGDAGVTAPGP
ncbi:MAG: hypothetical protein ACYCYO_00180 [Bacilli bacterium]